MLSKIKTLVFDFGNVLIDIDVIGGVERMKSLMGIDDPFDIYHAKPDYFRAYELGEISEELFLNYIIASAQRSIHAREVIDTWNSILLGIPEHRIHLLHDLKDKYRLILLSNTNKTHITWVNNYMDRTYGIKDFENTLFDDVYYSYRTGLRKPDPRFYRLVLDTIGHDGHSALFFDDMEINVLSANQCGLLSTLHLPEEDIQSHLKRLGLL